MNARIFIYIIIFFLCFIVFLVTYKFISCELKKASERMSGILVQCKTEEEKLKAMKSERRKNMKRCLKFVLFFYLGITILVFLFFFLFHKMSGSNIKPIGSYELFRENNVSYYGKYDYSIFCYNNGFFELSTYKIFDKKEETVFETQSYEEFISKLENMFINKKIDKINFYGTCTSDPGYKSLRHALNNSKLVESYELEKLQEGQLIHIKTKNGNTIKIEYLWEDMICTCKGV